MAVHSFWGLLSESVMSASVLEQGVLLFLVALSVLSWAVIIMKLLALRRLRQNNRLFHDVFAKAAHTGEVLVNGQGETTPTPLYAVFAAGMTARSAARAEVATTLPSDGDHIPLR